MQGEFTPGRSPKERGEEARLIKIGSDNLFCKTKNFSKFNM